MNDQATLPGSTDGGETRIAASVVSRGVAIGQAVCLYGRKRQFYRIALNSAQIDPEIERLDFAVKAATQQLASLAYPNVEGLPDIVSDIFDVHLLIIQESSLVQSLKGAIKTDKVNAEWAIKTVSEHYLARYREIPEGHLKEKSVDIEDVTERILNALYDEESVPRLPENAIIIASEIRPSTLMEFFNDHPAGLVTEHGGWTSHAFIMAREMGIPAVSGIKNVLRQVKTGEFVAVDALNGSLIFRPNIETQATLESLIENRSELERDPKLVSGIVKTIDNREIIIAANVDKPDLCRRAVEIGASGIGLLRTEYLFEILHGLPDENTQFKSFQEVVESAAGKTIRIRTFDLGIDQISTKTGGSEKNPALGLRAIRLSLSDEDSFRIQLRSILRASFEADVQIVLPLISDINEIIRTKAIIESEYENLSRDSIQFGKPTIGVMVEVPAAVICIEEILQLVDFVCLGTNDLVQYLVAVDRDNESIADRYQTLHPAVIRSVKIVLDAARSAGIPATVCGEMAGSPFYTPLLVGLGATDLSMNLHSISEVQKIIEGIAYSDTVELADSIRTSKTAFETEERLREFYLEKWPDLFPADLLSPNKTKPSEILPKN